MGAPARAERTTAPAAAAPVNAPPSRGGTTAAPALNGAPPAVKLSATVAANEVDLSSGQLVISNAADVKDGAGVDVDVRLPGLAEGRIKVWKNKDTFSTRGAGGAILLAHPALAPIAAPKVLVVSVSANVVTGYVTLGAPGVAKGKDRSLFNAIAKGADALNWLGLTNIAIPDVTNEFSGGALSLGASGMKFKVGGFLDGTGSFTISGNDLSLQGSAKINIPGGSEGSLTINRDPKGGLSGDGSVTVKVGGVSGTVTGVLSDGFVSVMGTVAYAGDKLSGSATLIATDEATARDVTLQKPKGGQPPALDVSAAKTNKPGKRAFCGFGVLTFQINDWLAGSAQVIINSKGEATILGEIAPPKEFILFEQKDWEKRLFKVEARGGYGIPVVGQVFVFASAEVKAKASVGPGKLYNIKLAGVYSTDKRVTRELTLEASLNISAFAGLIIRAEGGVGITILGHDIKAGVGIDATAGVRGYVEATPTIGMRKAPGQKTQYFIAGHMEIAAQPFLALGGDLFVSVETPWWSPLSDKRWTWPLFSLEYPLPGEFGIGADVNYVLGSKKWPEISFGEVAFDASKFTTDIMADNAPKGKGGETKKPGKWKEGTGGAPPGSKGGGGGGGGGPGKEKGAGDGFSGPIGEPVAFSDGHESHRLWIDEKGTNATLMAASEPGPVNFVLGAFERTVPLAASEDQGNARALISKARSQSQKADKEVDQVAAMKAAARNAKQYYETKGKSQKGKGPGKKGPELNSAVKADERALATTLTALFRVLALVPFKPAKKTAQMHGGSETLQPVEAGGAVNVNTDEGPIGRAVTHLTSGPISAARNPAGKEIVAALGRATDSALIEWKTIKVAKGKIVRKQSERLERSVDKMIKPMSHLGRALEIPNMRRAFSVKPVEPKKTVTFTLNLLPDPKHQQNLTKHVDEQLKRQQAGLNAMTVDAFIAGYDAYKAEKLASFDALRASAKKAVVNEVTARASDEVAKAKRLKKTVDETVAIDRMKLDDATKALALAKQGVKALPKDKSAASQAALKAARAERDRAREEKKEIERRIAATERVGQSVAASLPAAEALKQKLLDVDRNDPQAVRKILEDAEVAGTRTESGRKVGGLTGRHDNLAELNRAHEEAKRELDQEAMASEEWQGLINEEGKAISALLHDPDQVVAGKGKLALDEILVVKKPKAEPGPNASAEAKAQWAAWLRYRAEVKSYLGSQYVNARLGGFAGKDETRSGWGAEAPGLRASLKPIKQPAYGIWRMHVELKATYVPKKPA